MNPVCSTGCADTVNGLPTFKHDLCAPEVNVGEIENIYIGLRGEPFTDVESATEWTTRLASTTSTKLVKMVVMGDKPKPASNVKEISGNRKIQLPKDHVVNFTIDETNAENHEAIRQLQCGGNFNAWYETSGGLLFGGNEGLEVFIEADMVIPRSRGENLVYEGSMAWKANFLEERVVSPIA
jgi:hypothetical protein